MKKSFLVVAAIAAMAMTTTSCHQKELDAANARVDSLNTVNDQLTKQFEDATNLISEVEENFTAIKQDQMGLAEEATSTEGVNPDKKKQMQDNFQLIKDRMEENKQKIDELESKLASSNGRFAALQGTISNLRKQQAASEKEITSLKQQLEAKNIEIKDRDNQISSLHSQRDSVNNVSSAQAAKIKAQDEAMHTAYYIIGTKKDLKAKGLKEGVLKKADINKAIFTKVDVRTFEANEGMDLNVKKAILTTSHPLASYSLTPKSKSDKTLIFKIKNWESFWSNSKILVIQTK